MLTSINDQLLVCYSKKVDKASDPLRTKFEAEKREDTICISALSGDGLDEFCNAVQDKLKVLNLFQFCDISFKILVCLKPFIYFLLSQGFHGMGGSVDSI